MNQREVGARQESRAAEYLESLGYHILVRNFRCRFGEIDLIAKQDDTYIFIEVKYRTGRSAGDPTSAVDGKKQKKISKMKADLISGQNFLKQLKNKEQNRKNGRDKYCKYQVSLPHRFQHSMTMNRQL